MNIIVLFYVLFLCMGTSLTSMAAGAAMDDGGAGNQIVIDSIYDEDLEKLTKGMEDYQQDYVAEALQVMENDEEIHLFYKRVSDIWNMVGLTDPERHAEHRYMILKAVNSIPDENVAEYLKNLRIHYKMDKANGHIGSRPGDIADYVLTKLNFEEFSAG